MYNDVDKKVNTQRWVNLFRRMNAFTGVCFRSYGKLFKLRYYVPSQIVLMKLHPLFWFCDRYFYDVFQQYAH